MKIRVIALAISTIAVALAISSVVSNSPAQPPAGAPPGGPPPVDKPKKLKVLPKDMPRQQVVSIMNTFTRALGVQCGHCHAIKDGHPDFPSDDNPKKDLARGMMRMTDSINVQVGKLLPASAHGTDRVNVQCVTCHRGLTKPRTLADELAMKLDPGGADSALARYKTLREQYYGSGSYDFSAATLAEVAGRAQAKKDTKSQMALLQFNVQQFPQVGYAHQALAQGYLANGDTAKAIGELEQVVKLEPQNERAARALDRLKKR
jgi:hypothetical protein